MQSPLHKLSDHNNAYCEKMMIGGVIVFLTIPSILYNNTCISLISHIDNKI